MNTKYNSILIAPDKFKGSITAQEFCAVVENCIKSFNKNIKVLCCPLADGGDGSMQCFVDNTNSKLIAKEFTNANFEKVKSEYAIKKNIAFIELAQTCGLVGTKNKNPKITTTLGVGEQIKNAIENGAKTIYLAMGGSATNDAGCGMAVGLGYKFLDCNGVEFVPTGQSLCNIEKIVFPKSLSKIKVVALCDVNNVLYGKNGAAYVYAKQKGATDNDIELLDDNLKSFNNLCKKMGFDFQKIKGSGAAGGMGAGAMLFLNATLQSGIETFFKFGKIENKIKKSDLVITGEGKIDNQSEFGKVVFSLKAKCKNKKFVAFCGVNKLLNKPFEIIEINKINESLTDSIKNTKQNLIDAVNNYLNNNYSK